MKMKAKLGIILILGSLISLQVIAGEVCGSLSESNTCRFGQCIRYFLKDLDRGDNGNPYLIETESDEVALKLKKYANSGINVCIKGTVGVGGDPDLLEATNVTPLTNGIEIPNNSRIINQEFMTSTNKHISAESESCDPDQFLSQSAWCDCLYANEYDQWKNNCEIKPAPPRCGFHNCI